MKEVEDKEGNDVDEVDGGDVAVTTTELTDTSELETVSIQSCNNGIFIFYECFISECVYFFFMLSFQACDWDSFAITGS